MAECGLRTVIPFEDDDDAVRIANDSAYGLAGGVFSGSLERSLAVAHRMRAGVLSVNAGMPYSGRPSLRRLQGQRDRPTERHRRFRAVPRDEVAGLAGALSVALPSDPCLKLS